MATPEMEETVNISGTEPTGARLAMIAIVSSSSKATKP